MAKKDEPWKRWKNPCKGVEQKRYRGGDAQWVNCLNLVKNWITLHTDLR